jgi:hypothetical protein
MLYVRLANPFEAVVLDQLDGPTKSGFHVERQRFEFSPNAVIEQFHDPLYSTLIIAFLQYRRMMRQRG